MFRALLLPLVMAAVSGCSAADSDTPTSPLAAVEGELPGAVLSVAPSGTGLLFAGGTTAPDGGFILQLKGDAIRPMATPSGPALWWITTRGERAWAVGDQGRLLSLHEGVWSAEDTGLDEKAILWGVFAAGDDDLWAVGGSYRRGGPKGLVLRSSGDGVWRRVEDPALPDNANLYKVWGRGPNDLYIVGELGVTLRWDGAAFSHVDAADTRLLFTVHGDAEIYAVGGIDRSRIFRREGDGWIDESPADGQGLNGVFAGPGGQVVAVGARGVVLDRTGQGEWTRRSPNPTLSRGGLHAVFIDDDAIWTVGGDLLDLTWGTIATDRQPLPVWSPDE